MKTYSRVIDVVIFLNNIYYATPKCIKGSLTSSHSILSFLLPWQVGRRLLPSLGLLLLKHLDTFDPVPSTSLHPRSYVKLPQPKTLLLASILSRLPCNHSSLTLERLSEWLIEPPERDCLDSHPTACAYIQPTQT